MGWHSSRGTGKVMLKHSSESRRKSKMENANALTNTGKSYVSSSHNKAMNSVTRMRKQNTNAFFQPFSNFQILDSALRKILDVHAPKDNE